MCPVFPFDLAGDPGLNRSTINLRKTGKTRAAMEAIAVKVAFALCLVADTGPLARAQKTSGASAPEVATVRVDADPRHRLNSFDPDQSLGSSIDVLSRSGIDKVYTPHIIQESLSAGWGPISYRNNTELRMAAWHWTENGSWSDPVSRSGYFTGSTELREPLRYIAAYALPHRGFSSSGDRPVEGPNLTYWKSNPYLTSKFTGESDALHPQWVVVDLRSPKAVSALRIAWASPYATAYQVEYWVGKDALDFDHGPEGEWQLFSSGAVKNAHGGTVILRLAPAPVAARFLRVWMTESSNTCDVHGSNDVRNCVGYAIQEIQAGTLDPSGVFVDVSKDATGDHAPAFCSSSIDPWHSETDVNATGNYQHSGFDLFFHQRDYQPSARDDSGDDALWHA